MTHLQETITVFAYESVYVFWTPKLAFEQSVCLQALLQQRTSFIHEEISTSALKTQARASVLPKCWYPSTSLRAV